MKESPYIELLQITTECREKMVNDTISLGSPDLYDALYGNAKNKIHEIQFELYELIWLEYHWQRMCEVIEGSEGSKIEKREFISMIARMYGEFIGNWNCSEFDIKIIKEKMNILKTLISTNNEWDINLKKMKVQFMQSKKRLELRIKKLEGEV